MKAVTFQQVIEAAPVNHYITEHGPVKGIVYCEAADLLFCFLPKMVLAYHWNQGYWSAPIDLIGEFEDATTIKGTVYVATTTGIYQLSFQ